MKKFICFILTAVLCLAICSCNDNSSEKAMLKLHNTAQTDIIKLTLDNAKFTIALDNTNGNNYGTIKEYDELKDVKNPFVAAKGHTLVAFSFTLENLDRQSIDLGGSFNGRFISLRYNDQIYGDAGQTHILASGTDKFNWDQYTYGNILIKPSETLMYRGYMDIPVEVGNLNDSFDLTFSLLNSKGGTEEYTFSVTAEDRDSYTEPEISLELALENFDKKEAREVIANHIDEYIVLNGTQITELVSGNWHKVKEFSTGTWIGSFRFEKDGKIFEKSDNGYAVGYTNNRTWTVEGDKLILTSKPDKNVKTTVYTAYQIPDVGYYLVSDDGISVTAMH